MNKIRHIDSPLKTMIPIIKIVGDYCNLKCKYCFYFTKDQNTSTIMDINLLERFIKQYLNLFNGPFRFIWHGGEPMLASLDFFEQIIEIQNHYSKNYQNICNSIQTNATLVNDNWAKFFKKNNFCVGVSLDGHKIVHNKFRSSFDKTIEGINILRKYGIQPGIIQTITKNSINYTKECFEFFTDYLCLKGWGCNLFLDTMGENEVMRDQNLTNDQLSRFFLDYIDLWLEKNNPNLKIREIENFIAGVSNGNIRNCTYNGTCTGFFCLNYDGDIYPCDRLSENKEYFLAVY